MDFGQLLHTAQKNEKSKDQRVKFYSTKFEPPKKEKKQSSQLSQNIKKFLAKKEAEEKRKLEEDKKKRDELLALRSQDKKATKRVNVMLKRTKSANQSVISDAVDNDNTAVTLAGPMQPDEDDYGYVSQEASQFYNKMMEKYNKMPDEPKFDMNKKKVSTNLGSTKDRVRAALEKEREEALLPHKRKRKHKEKDEDEEGVSYDAPDRNVDEKTSNEKSDKDKSTPKPKPKLPAPPPMNFYDLLKIAEKKQFEPIVIEKKEKEEERLLTKKQRKEMERERESQMRREERRREMANGKIPKVPPKVAEKEKEKPSLKIPKLSDSSNSSKTATKLESEKTLNKSTITGKEKSGKNSVGVSKTSNKSKEEELVVEEYISGKYLPGDIRYRPELENKKPSTSVLNDKKRPDMPQKAIVTDKKPTPNNLQMKKNPTSDMRPSNNSHPKIPNKNPPSNMPQKKPSMESQTKRFPPEDVRRKVPSKQLPPSDFRRRDERMGMSRKMAPPIRKGRIMDDDDSEYDSEMDDFIDDGDADQDYSKYISEIFGYDKSRYRDIDEEDDNMETTFAQQMREEVISTKIGIMEDLEEERKESEAKRRKMIMKKKMR